VGVWVGCGWVEGWARVWGVIGDGSAGRGKRGAARTAVLLGFFGSRYRRFRCKTITTLESAEMAMGL
jgi:hypothetical protein